MGNTEARAMMSVQLERRKALFEQRHLSQDLCDKKVGTTKARTQTQQQVLVVESKAKSPQMHQCEGGMGSRRVRVGTFL